MTNDTIDAGGDSDIIVSGAGDDSIDGGAGFDQARFSAAIGEFDVTKAADVYTIVSEEGTDTLTNVEEFVFGDMALSAAQMDALAGTADRDLGGTDGDDFIFSGTGNDTINAGDGDDFIFSGEGHDVIESGVDNSNATDNDTICAGDGNDTIRAGDGDDWLSGGSGDDELFGGAGADTFVFNTGHDSDVIHDFELGIDTLRLSGALTDGKSAADIVSTYATLTNGAVVFDFGGDDIITISNLNSLTGLEKNIEIF